MATAATDHNKLITQQYNIATPPPHLPDLRLLQFPHPVPFGTHHEWAAD